MFIRFRAETYQVDGKTMVDVFDHQNGQTETMSLAQYQTKEGGYYNYNGAVIFGQRIKQSSNKKADT